MVFGVREFCSVLFSWAFVSYPRVRVNTINYRSFFLLLSFRTTWTRKKESKSLSVSGRCFSIVSDDRLDMGSEHFCLRWNNHQSNLLGVFSQLLQDESLVDVTLACAEGHSIRAHKVVLSACSSYFQTLFVDHPNRHPIVILKDVCFAELRTLVEFMYKGEVSVESCQLSALLKTAESLKVKGLAEMTNLNSTGSTTIRRERAEERSAEAKGDASTMTTTMTTTATNATATTTPVTETVDKRLMNEDTNSSPSQRNASPGPPPCKRPSRGPDCEDGSDCERDGRATPDRNEMRAGYSGPTDMSASGKALAQMPPSCPSPHSSEPFPGPSCLPPVQQVPLVSTDPVFFRRKPARQPRTDAFNLAFCGEWRN